MSATSTSKCLFCTFTRSARPAPPTIRHFSSSPRQLVRKPKFASVKATTSTIPTLSEAYLEKNFTPAQRAAIQAANNVIDNDNIKQVENYRHPWSPKYVDDLAQIDTSMDHAVKQPWKNIDQKSRLKTEDEIDEDLYKFMNNLPDDDEAAVEAWQKFDQNMRLTVGREEAERHPRSATAPDLPKMGKKLEKKKKSTEDNDDERTGGLEMTPEVVRLMQATGMSLRQISRLRIKTILHRRVANQTRLGKIYSRYYLSVAGNENGLVGIGEGKADEGPEAAEQSRFAAIRNMRPVMRYENRTIFGDVDGKVGATELQLCARSPGFGLRCQHIIYEICKAAGISDISARVTRARNPMNTAKGTMQALLSQKDPEEIAKGRGKKLVDVRKVYYANQI